MHIVHLTAKAYYFDQNWYTSFNISLTPEYTVTEKADTGPHIFIIPQTTWFIKTRDLESSRKHFTIFHANLSEKVTQIL